MAALRIGMCGLALAACTATNVVAPAGGDDLDPAPGDPTPHRLTQTDDTTVGYGLSIACADRNGTLDNSWYRVFDLRAYRITKPFTVNRVNFGVQSAIGRQRVKVSLGAYAGDAGAEQLDASKIDTLAMTTIPVVPTNTGEMMQANFAAVEIPAATNLVVEIRTEGHSRANGSFFYLGATEGGETVPGYLRAPACTGPDPLMTSALGYAKSHLIISVSGSVSGTD